MTPQESLDRVAELLAALPGTTVDTHWCAEGTAHVYLRTQSLDSLAVIVRDATFANAKSVDVHFVGPPERHSTSSEAHKLQFRLAMASHDDDGDPPTTLQIFGIFLVRHLKAAGLVSREVADDLQQRWNAAVM
jgi:hypothetical protein